MSGNQPDLVSVVLRCVLGNTTILAEFVSEEDVARYFAHSQASGSGSGNAAGGSVVPGSSGAPGSSGSAGASAGVPGAERDRAGGNGGSTVVVGGNGASGVGAGAGGPGVAVGVAVGAPGSGWQSLDGTGSSPDAASSTSSQGAGLSIFAQWSSNGAGGGGGGGGMVEPGRGQGLWGGMPSGYPVGSSLWGSPAMDDRHQMSSPAALLPGDLLGGGADSI